MGTSGGPEGELIQHVENMLEKKLTDTSRNRRRREEFTIFRVPPNLHNEGLSVYWPRVISIGPYHHGDPNLSAMENRKLFYLNQFLHRNPKVTLKNYVEKMVELEGRARNCYSDEKLTVGRGEFVEMLLVDGGFLVMFVLMYGHKYRDDPPIQGTDWSLVLVLCDLLKLENQLPFFIIQELIQMAAISSDNMFLNKLIELYSCIKMFSKIGIPGERPIHHFLHLFQMSLQGCIPSTQISRQTPRMEDPSAPVYFRKKEEARTVLQLIESGVKFTTKPNRSMLDITFTNGVLEFPQMSIDETFEVCLRNLVSLEQCNVKYGNHFTSYACFIDNLVDAPGDVAILEQKKVFANLLGSNENVAKVFNQLGLGVIHHTTSSYLNGAEDGMKKYCDSRWPKWRAMLVRDYLNNPWVITSLIAGFAILILTFAQTYFTIIPYYLP